MKDLFWLTVSEGFDPRLWGRHGNSGDLFVVMEHKAAVHIITEQAESIGSETGPGCDLRRPTLSVLLPPTRSHLLRQLERQLLSAGLNIHDTSL